MAKSAEFRPASPAPATPAKTALKSTSRRRRRPHLARTPRRRRGIRHQALRSGLPQYVAPGIQNGALRPRDPRFHLHLSRPISPGSSSSIKAISWEGRAVKQKEAGVSRKLIGFEMRGRGIGRDGYEVWLDGSPAGWVTSGSPSPTLNKNIGLCYLPAEHAKLGRKSKSSSGINRWRPRRSPRRFINEGK